MQYQLLLVSANNLLVILLIYQLSNKIVFIVTIIMLTVGYNIIINNTLLQ